MPTRPPRQHSQEVFSESGSSFTIQVGDSPSIDAFARLRVSDIVGLFDSQNQYDTSPLFWEDNITSNSGLVTGTHLPDESAVRLTIGSNDTFIRQTRAYHRYQPGKSQLLLMTFAGFTVASDVTRRIGYFDGANGIFLEINNSTINFVVRSSASGSPVNTQVAKGSWNLDRLDGAGSSGKTLDLTASQILIIDLEWLGVGRVRVGFVIDGIPVYCHQFLNANLNSTVYMTTANLPLRYEIAATADATGTHDLIAICAQVASEGGFEEERGAPFSASNGTTLISVTTRRPILSIRPKQTFNAITNRGVILPENVRIFSEDQSAFYEIVYGGTLTGASFASVDDNSIVESDVAASAISGGIVIGSDYLSAGGAGQSARAGATGQPLLSKLPLSLNVDGDHPTSPLTDVLTIVQTSIPGTATDSGASIWWREIR